MSLACAKLSVPVVKCTQRSLVLNLTCKRLLRGLLYKVARPSKMKVVSGNGFTETSLVSCLGIEQPMNIEVNDLKFAYKI